ncbi:HPr family phosphocarrier protein [Candidatus Woesearchaeota archaeon]|nr:HPr family phosphocarrier protein [Candidatus Woesearchaeota archaeon]
MQEEKPELRKEKGFTYIDDIVVNAKPGMAIRPSLAITEECREYIPRKVYFVNKKGEDFNCINIMEIMFMGIQQGHEITVKVEGEDKEAERMALRLYSALKSENAYKMDFNRFE